MAKVMSKVVVKRAFFGIFVCVAAANSEAVNNNNI